MEENRGSKREINLPQVIVPVLLIVAVAIVWFIKDSGNSVDNPTPLNPDFALTVTGKIDLVQLESYGLPIIIEFGSDSCAPCQEMAPIIEELNTELQGKAIIRFADVWEDPALAEGFPLSVIPTQLFITSEGEPYDPADPEAMDMLIHQSQTDGTHIYTTHEGIIAKEALLQILKEMGMQ